jgi:type I restriction enzyme S subunit
MGSEWKTLTLREAGITLIDCDHRTPSAAPSGYPYITIPQLKDGHIDVADARRITRHDYENWTKKLKPRVHDVIIVRRCSSGVSAVIPKGLECAIGQNLVVLRSDGRQVLPEFLRWLVRGDEWWEQVRKFLNVGAVFDSLKCKDIPNFEVPIPPLEYQLVITQLLNGLDDKIALLRETNATLEAIAQALFKSWFVDFDPARAKAEGCNPEGVPPDVVDLFPGEFEDSELGAMPKGWRIARVGDLLELAYGKALKATDRQPGAVPVYGSGGINGTHNRALIDMPTVIVGRKGTVGSLYWEERSCFPIDTVFYVKPMLASLEFCYRVLQAQPLRDMNTDAAVPGLNRENVYRLKFCLPHEKCCHAFDDITGPLRNRMQTNLNEIELLSNLRDALLPRLMSGKLRIPEAEEAFV